MLKYFPFSIFQARPSRLQSWPNYSTRMNILAQRSRADCSLGTQLSFLDGSLRWNMNDSLKPGISMKRKADDDPSSSSFNHTKVIKTEKLDSSPNYSQDVKKKISASARTGQACDRCRVSPSSDTVHCLLWKIHS